MVAEEGGGRGRTKVCPKFFFLLYLLIIFVSEEPRPSGTYRGQCPTHISPLCIRCVPNLSKPKKHVQGTCFLGCSCAEHHKHIHNGVLVLLGTSPPLLHCAKRQKHAFLGVFLLLGTLSRT